MNSSYHYFQVVTKPIGAVCNLNCTYCFYLEKINLYKKQSDFRMPDKVLESYIRQMIEAQPANRVSFIWQGGEPTLSGIVFFQRVIDLQRKYAAGKRIENSIQTNGMSLNDEWCGFLKKHEFLVGISLDGPQNLHDYYRKDSKGKGTHESVMKGMECLIKHDVPFNTLTCVNRHNSYFPLEVYRFLKDAGSRYMQFIPVVGRKNNFSDVTEWSVEADQYGEFLCKIFDEWVKNDVGKYYVQHFDVALESWMGKRPSLCIFNKTCGNAPALEHNGDLYSCDHYVNPQNKLGNIMDRSLMDLVGSEQQRKFGQKKENELPDYCRQCEACFACNGGCPKNRFINTPDGEPGLNYLCTGYKTFFTHIRPYMEFMAGELTAQRPPANVMQWKKDKKS